MNLKFIRTGLLLYTFITLAHIQPKQLPHDPHPQKLPQFTPIQKIISHEKHKVRDTLTLPELFEENEAPLAILVYDSHEKKYYDYDEAQVDFYKSKSNWYYVVVDEDQKPMVIGLTSEIISLNPFDEALEGDAEAQQQVGLYYRCPDLCHTCSFTQNSNRSFQWTMKSAEQGFAEAQYEAGCMISKGEGTQKDPKAAFEWLKKAAQQENRGAQLCLGYCYELGHGVEPDMAKAIEIYTYVANKNDFEAQYELAGCYATGTGVTQDYDKALYWYQRAAKGRMIIWATPEAARAAIALIHEEGLGSTQKNEKEAFEWYSKAVHSNSTDNCPMAANNLALYYLDGRIVDEKDPDYAFQLLNCAAQDLVVAQINLGLFHEYGFGKAKNPTSAFIWYQKAASQGNIEGIFHLGRCFFYGIGTNQNYHKAEQLFQQAAQHGHKEATLYLGHLYEFGLGVKQNFETAQIWYKQAKNNNITEAGSALNRCSKQEKLEDNGRKLLYQHYRSQKPLLLKERAWRWPKTHKTVKK